MSWSSRGLEIRGGGAVTENPNMPPKDNRRISTGWISFNRDLQELYDRPKESLLDLKARMVMSELVEVLYETHWNGILRPTREREMDLQAFRHLILAYRADGPDHHQPNTQQNQQLRINAAAREIARANGERHLPGS